MSLRLVRCLICLLITSQILQSQSVERDDIKASQRSCRIVQLTLAARERQRAKGDVPEDEVFTVAGKACKSMEKAVADGDSAEIGKATESLRPVFALLGVPPSTPREQFAALEKKTAGLRGRDLFYELADLAKRAFNAGQTDKAEAYGNQLLSEAPNYRSDWNYGNAIFFGNFILGRVALSRGNAEQASQYLLASGKTKGSPQLDSFGPNMTLAKELLEKGQSEAVLQYLELCKHFWEGHRQQLDEWRQAIRNGKTPDFGANLNY
jgi:hypothetical protein